MIFEPKWKSLLANTTESLFLPLNNVRILLTWVISKKLEEAKVGHKEKAGGNYDTKMKNLPPSSWIPFKALPDDVSNY